MTPPTTPTSWQPLDGTLVVSLEQAVAAPLASCRLADAGARVIKVERPGGDFARHYDRAAGGESAYFAWLNRGKESLVADLRDDGDAALLRRVLARADVFIQNLAPGAATRLGFASDELRAHHPRLITCDISGYGEEGPEAGRRAYDLLVQAESGLASITGSPAGIGRVGVSVCDVATGMYAHAAILEALIERRRTGVGRGLHASLFASMADWMSVPLLFYDYSQRVWPRVGLAHPSIAPYGVYALSQGREILIGIQNDAEFRRFADDFLGEPALADDERFATNRTRVTNRGVLDAVIAAVFARHDEASASEGLRRAKIAYGFVNSVADLSDHPQLHRTTVASPSGELRMPAPAVRISGHQPELGPVPACGEHSDRLRREFG